MVACRYSATALAKRLTRIASPRTGIYTKEHRRITVKSHNPQGKD